MRQEPGAAASWQALYDRFIQMDDEDWERVDRRLGREFPPEKVEEIQEDFVAFTRFVWSNFVDLKLELEEPVVERILAARGVEAFRDLGVKRENLAVLTPDDR